MTHIYVQDPPSRDLTAAAARQAELDAKVEQYLARGGKITVLDVVKSDAHYDWGQFTVASSARLLEVRGGV